MINHEVFRGCIPALMTPCDADGKPDFQALARKGKELIGHGMRSVVYCGSMGDWPLLTLQQRKAGVEALLNAGVPTIVGTGAQNTRDAVEIADHAARVGASGLMIIPRLLSRPTSTPAQKAHLHHVLQAASSLPSVIYNSPYYGFQTRADLFFALREQNPNLVGFKEFGGADALSYAAENITSGHPELILLVGVDTQVYHGYLRCGAGGAITGIGNALPIPVLTLIDLCKAAVAGDSTARRRAFELDSALGVLSSFDESPDLVLYYKRLLVLEGNPEYHHHFNAFDELSRSQHALLESQWQLFKSWWTHWNNK